MKILILKTSSLGDIIHAFPAVSDLRKRFPEAQIDWVVERAGAPLVERHPEVNRVLVIDSKRWRRAWLRSRREMAAFRRALRATQYDVVYDLQGNVKSSAILAFTRAKKKVGFSWKSVPEWPNALFTNEKVNPSLGKNIREQYLEVVGGGSAQAAGATLLTLKCDEQAQVDAVLSDATLVVPGSAWPNKQLSFEQLKRLLVHLEASPHLFAWGSEAEREFVSKLAESFPGSVVLPKLSLPALQHVMAKSALVVSMDSLPLHLAATTGVATLSFFGPSSSAKYAPTGPQHRSVQGACPYGVTFEKRCPRLRTCATGACLKSLEVSAMIQQIGPKQALQPE